jgi:hypothetical protein
MDWTKQAEEMAQTWTEAQQKMWDNWLKTVQGFGQSPAAEMWAKTIDTWEEMIKNGLETQAEWSRLWAENFNKVGAPKEMNEWAQQTQEMMKQWSEAQKQLWDNWFSIAKKVNPAGSTEGWSKESQKIYQTWQESMQKLMATQNEWFRQWDASKSNESTKKKA